MTIQQKRQLQPHPPPLRRVIVGISGASGAILGLKALELLRQQPATEVHLVISRPGQRTLNHEIDETAAKRACALAHITYPVDDIGATIASGSFRTDAMIIAPCSMRTLSAIAYGASDNLLTRAADVILKERRRLVLLARETPLHGGHIEAMQRVTQLGAIVMPPVPSFYAGHTTLDAIATQIVARALDVCGIDVGDVLYRWQGTGAR
ncbi:MAG: UbiX family flavin prenyltransferase [Hyphomicrobium sp.]|nr:UbiX family flavin prenyltransferase [Hyphomicrobium sp.]